MSEANEREAFEVWAFDLLRHDGAIGNGREMILMRSRTVPAAYMSDTVDRMWLAWQAARERPAADKEWPMPEVVGPAQFEAAKADAANSHSPWLLRMPGTTACLQFNHYPEDAVDEGRCKWVAEACNAALRSELEARWTVDGTNEVFRSLAEAQQYQRSVAHFYTQPPAIRRKETA